MEQVERIVSSETDLEEVIINLKKEIPEDNLILPNTSSIASRM